MDRQTIYYGQVPVETDLLKAQQNAMVAIAKLAEGVLGTGTLVDGFTLVPTSPATFSAVLSAGSVFQLENLEATSWSSLPADIGHSIVKHGINLDTTTLTFTPPGTTGYSQIFLVEVEYADLDTGSTVLPYYNAANPNSPFSGPGNAGTAQNTVRRGIVAVQIKAGTAATTGTQTAPTADAGWTGLFTVTLANGDTSVTSGAIVQLTAAPFVYPKIPKIPSEAQAGKWLYGVDTGSADALSVTLNPVPAALVPGMTIRTKKSANANATTTPTLNVGLGANTIKRSGGAACVAGDLPASAMLEFSWDGSFWQITNFQGFNATTVNNNNYTLTLPYCVDSSGTPNTITAPFSPTITSLSAGDMLRVKLANTVTGPTTIAVNSIAAKAVVRPDGSALHANDAYAGQILILEYDGTNCQVINLAPNAGRNTGDIYMVPYETAPAGTLECTGAPISRSTFAALFAKISTTHGVGDGSTTFNLPDYRGYFLRGWSHGSGRDPDAAARTDRGDGTTGDHVGTIQGVAAGPISLSGISLAFTSTTLGEGGVIDGGSWGAPLLVDTGNSFRSWLNFAATTSISGNSGSTETRPKNKTIMFVIAY